MDVLRYDVRGVIDVCDTMTDIDFLVSSTLTLSLYTLADVRVITVQAIIQL